MNCDHLVASRDFFVSKLIRQKARRLARQPGFNKSELDDVEQELMLEVPQKYACFDANRASERTFIARIIKNKVVSLIRTRKAEKRDFRRNGSSLNDTIRDADGEVMERTQTLDASTATNHMGQSRRTNEEVAELRWDTAALLNSLPNDLRQLAELLKEQPEYAASRVLGKSRRQVAKKVARLRGLFEDANLREYL